MAAIDPHTVSEPEAPHISSVEDLFEDDEHEGQKPAPEPVVSIIREPATEPVRDVLPDSMPGLATDEGSFFEEEPYPVTITGNDAEDDSANEDSIADDSDAAPGYGQDIAFDRTQWLDLLKWSHHCDALEPDQRMQIVRMGRLIQKGRKLTRKQEEQVLEMVALVKNLGYHFR
jgi:hypothetical protein